MRFIWRAWQQVRQQQQQLCQAPEQPPLLHPPPPPSTLSFNSLTISSNPTSTPRMEVPNNGVISPEYSAVLINREAVPASSAGTTMNECSALNIPGMGIEAVHEKVLASTSIFEKDALNEIFFWFGATNVGRTAEPFLNSSTRTTGITAFHSL